MITRLSFLKQSALFSSALFVKPASLLLKTNKIGLGLYTLRNELSKDVTDTLTKVKKLGYTDVETFGFNGKFWGMTSSELSKLLKSLGLVSTSGHYFPAESFLEPNWKEKWKPAIEASVTLGQEYIVVPYMGATFRSIENYKKFAEAFNQAAVLCKKSNLTFAYHNHNFEFENQGGQNGFDILMKTDPIVKFEMDIYWVRFASQDPIAIMKAHPGRFPLWHVKDMDKTEKKSFTEVGNGVIDFKQIFDIAKMSGMKHFYVEQDQSPGSPFDSIAQSIAYLKKSVLIK